MPTGSGRKKSIVFDLFRDAKSEGKIAKVECIYYGTKTKNGTRMKKHIERCKKCDKVVKKIVNPQTTHDNLVNDEIDREHYRTVDREH